MLTLVDLNCWVQCCFLVSRFGLACWTEIHRLQKIPQLVANIARDIFIIAALVLVVQSRLLHQHHAQPQQVALEQQELAVRVLADRNFQFAVNWRYVPRQLIQ